MSADKRSSSNIAAEEMNTIFESKTREFSSSAEPNWWMIGAFEFKLQKERVSVLAYKTI